jgi:hypothetical protein
MAATNLDRLLRSIGKRTFIEFYRAFADSSISNLDLIDMLPSEYTLKSRRSRVSKARRILREGRDREALEIIRDSPNVGETISQRAQALLRTCSAG